MANLQERRNKDGKLISYSIRVYRGRSADGKQLKPYTTTFDVPPKWTELTAHKKAVDYAAVFEKNCNSGEGGLEDGSRQTFEQYCNYVLEQKEQNGTKHSTIARYKDLTKRIYPAIGYLKLKDITPRHLNTLYGKLLNTPCINNPQKTLSAKTVVEYHRLISTVLTQAEKEMFVAYNAAAKATTPKVKQKEVNYFQPEEIEQIKKALDNEGLMWKVLCYMLILTGARRGELLGLKWKNVDFANNRIGIFNNLLYSSDIGIYEDSPKEVASNRYIALPVEMCNLLKEYKDWQDGEKLRLQGCFIDKDFVFAGDRGQALHPDSVTTYLARLSKKYKNLPHINPHAFRHSMASILFCNGADAVSISKRLGHAQVSTTTNIYAHIIKKTDVENAEIVGNIFLSGR